MAGPRTHNATPITVTIPTDADGQSNEVYNLEGKLPVGIYMPGTWTAGGITYLACDTADGTFLSVYGTDGNELATTTAASRYVALDIEQFHGIRFLKVRSGTSGTPVQQGAERTLTLMVAATDRY